MPSARGDATMVSPVVSPVVTARSSRSASVLRNARSDSSCQSVCSIELRAPPIDWCTLPGGELPCADVERSGCSCTSLVCRLGNMRSPIFSRISAFRPSQTTIQSPVPILIFVIQKLRRRSVLVLRKQETLSQQETLGLEQERLALKIDQRCSSKSSKDLPNCDKASSR